MTNLILRNLLGIALPLALACGCASNHQPSGVAVIPHQAAPPPTSDINANRVYSGDAANIGQYTPPPGAPSSEWALAEQVRSALTADPKLAREPVAVVVNNGVVTLRGYVHNDSQRQKILAAVGALPGVTQVNDQMEVNNILHSIPGESKTY